MIRKGAHRSSGKDHAQAKGWGRVLIQSEPIGLWRGTPVRIGLTLPSELHLYNAARMPNIIEAKRQRIVV